MALRWDREEEGEVTLSDFFPSFFFFSFFSFSFFFFPLKTPLSFPHPLSPPLQSSFLLYCLKALALTWSTSFNCFDLRHQTQLQQGKGLEEEEEEEEEEEDNGINYYT